jgi:hypothetical protein
MQWTKKLQLSMFDIAALDVLDSQLITRKLTIKTKYNLILTPFIAEEEKKKLQTLDPDADDADSAIVESSSQQIDSLDKKLQPYDANPADYVPTMQ